MVAILAPAVTVNLVIEILTTVAGGAHWTAEHNWQVALPENVNMVTSQTMQILLSY